LQDTDNAVEANHSTGLLTPPTPALVRKTRLVAARLDELGFDTALIERRLDPRMRTTDGDVHVALLGVDNLPTRRLISSVGWPLAIDVGLGVGPSDFDALLLHRFPGARDSAAMAGWSGPSIASTVVPKTPAFDDLGRRDPCGVVQVAGTAVGAAFVGVIAACVAVTEAVREVMGQPGYDVINLHLRTADVFTAAASGMNEVVAARLLPDD
jgi:hypothetical protein